MKLQITDREGERISFFRALWRNILRSLTFYAYCFLLPLIYQYFRFRKTKKLFHDELSNTVIGERLDAAQQPSEAAKKEEQEPRIRVAEQLILGSEVSEVNGYTSKVTILLESLMNWLKSAWSWLSKPNPKKTLAFIGGALAIATGGVWQAYVTTGITLEQNEAGLNTNETRAKLPNTENADKAKAYYPPYGHNNDYPPAISAQDYLQLDISEKLPLGPDHPDVAQSLNNRAEQYWEQGAYAKAEPLYLQSLKIREKALGPDHPDVAVSLNNLAEIYWAQLAYAKAEPLYQRSLRILEKALGPDHIKVAQSRNNLAKLYWAQGKYAKAERFLKRSLKIREKALGPDNPQVTTSHQNYTALLEIEAEAMKTRANAIQAKHK
jgi:tetratricopeptide (TPR) repeat protein